MKPAKTSERPSTEKSLKNPMSCWGGSTDLPMRVELVSTKLMKTVIQLFEKLTRKFLSMLITTSS